MNEEPAGDMIQVKSKDQQTASTWQAKLVHLGTQQVCTGP